MNIKILKVNLNNLLKLKKNNFTIFTKNFKNESFIFL